MLRDEPGAMLRPPPECSSPADYWLRMLRKQRIVGHHLLNILRYSPVPIIANKVIQRRNKQFALPIPIIKRTEWRRLQIGDEPYALRTNILDDLRKRSLKFMEFLPYLR